MTGTKRHWVAYLRVSTTSQEDHGIGLDVQEDRVREWATERGIALQHVYTDACSGALIDREGLGLLLMECKRGDIGGVIIARLDRLARDVLVQEWIIAQLGRRKVMLRSAQDAENRLLDDLEGQNDPTRKFMRVVLGAAIELERASIVARTHAARRKMAAEGKYIGGTKMNGFTYDKDTKMIGVADEFVALARDGLRMRELGLAYETIGEFWLQAGWRPGRPPRRKGDDPNVPKLARGGWQATSVRRKLMQLAKTGLKPSAQLSAQAALYSRGKR